VRRSDAVPGSLGWRAIFFGKNAGKMAVKLVWVAILGL
jgi:hypothetical protein